MCGVRAVASAGEELHVERGAPLSLRLGPPHAGQEGRPLHLHRHAPQLDAVAARIGVQELLRGGAAQLVLAVVELVLEGLDHRPGVPGPFAGLGDAVPLQVAVHPPPGGVAQIASAPLVGVGLPAVHQPGQAPVEVLELGVGPAFAGVGDAGAIERLSGVVHQERPRVRGRGSACPGSGTAARRPSSPGQGAEPLVPGRRSLVHRLQGPPGGLLLPLPALERRPGRPRFPPPG